MTEKLIIRRQCRLLSAKVVWKREPQKNETKKFKINYLRAAMLRLSRYNSVFCLRSFIDEILSSVYRLVLIKYDGMYYWFLH